MKKQILITIGREYGSGGREIGRRLAEKLQFAFFDYQIVTELAKRTAFAEEYILSIQEKRPYPVLPVPTVRMWAPPNPMLDQHLEVFLKESEVIRDMADKAPCVIVGRCADYALAGRPGLLRIFCRADLGQRIRRIEQRHNLSKKKAALLVAKTDRHRRVYYHHHTGQFWGHSSCYDLTVNTGVLGVEKTAETMEAFIRTFWEQD